MLVMALFEMAELARIVELMIPVKLAMGELAPVIKLERVLVGMVYFILKSYTFR